MAVGSQVGLGNWGDGKSRQRAHIYYSQQKRMLTPCCRMGVKVFTRDGCYLLAWQCLCRRRRFYTEPQNCRVRLPPAT